MRYNDAFGCPIDRVAFYHQLTGIFLIPGQQRMWFERDFDCIGRYRILDPDATIPHWLAPWLIRIAVICFVLNAIWLLCIVVNTIITTTK